MIGSHLKIALRHMFSHRMYAVINVLGLSIGLASFLLIALFVRHELSFDRFHPGWERTYRLGLDFDNGDRFWASSQYHLIPALEADFPEIEAAGRLMVATVPVRRGNEAFNEEGFRLVDPGIFDLFAFEWLQGEPSRALAEPFTLVLTESAARRYFGDDNPMGQTLDVNNQAPMRVTGVIADLPDNTHLSGEIFTAMSTGVAAYGEETLAGTFDFHSYVRLREGADISALGTAFDARLAAVMPQNFRAAASVRVDLLADVHSNPLRNEMPGTPGSMATVYTFVGIALAILAIACINFMNLSTARSTQRAREVGLRKSIGAGRRQLIAQFLGESLAYAALATLLALTLVELLLPVFGNFIGKEIQLDLTGDPFWPALLCSLWFVVGIVAGSYPALYLTRFEPAKVLKGDASRGRAGMLFRNVLVVIQFAVAIVLIVATAVMYGQIRYARDIEPGYERERIVVLDGAVTQALGTQWETMKQELLAHPGISRVTASRIPPGVDNFSDNAIFHAGGPPDGTPITFLPVDFDYFETYGISLLSGRTFDANLGTDRMRFPFGGQTPSVAWMLNESAARMLGWIPGEAVGKNLSWSSANGLTGPVIGVVEDVYYESARTPLKPLLYMVTASGYGGASSPLSLSTASLLLTGEDLAGTLAHIDRTWAQFMQGLPLSRYFLDANFARMYAAEEKQNQLLACFALLAVSIAVLGLYGLAAFNVERRFKEIGVRKVMGGSAWSIVWLLTHDFSRLVLVSNVIAWPLAYVAMSRWLENFAYRIDLTPVIFIGSSLIALCVAWVTVAGTTVKAANAKPVLALRYE